MITRTGIVLDRDTLLDNDPVDALRLLVFPVTIGDGLRLFPIPTGSERRG